ncbi:hypothetical protein BA062_19405 [Prauserella flavalba]|uniref:Uncharacterized protein n=1 Tax=Prauserella flavalba TaxID=1477506 RepID=A0A318LJ53_9PSEU|nr:hypothetical protein BA062_19405 [Prauserella flavalba]
MPLLISAKPRNVGGTIRERPKGNRDVTAEQNTAKRCAIREAKGCREEGVATALGCQPKVSGH